MKLILLSKNFIEPAQAALREFTNKQNSEIKIAFCANAGDVYCEDKRKYIDIARNELNNSGYTLIKIDLNLPLNEILEIFEKVDATFFTGGSYYNLMALFNSSGLTTKYRSLLKKGLVHIGFSAGAMICSNDFRAYDVFGEPEY